MPKPTPLHTHPEQIGEYHAVATSLLRALSTDVDNLAASNDDEQAAYPDDPARFLADRFEIIEWLDHTVQQLRDAMYLLAVGDNGPTAVAQADPDGATRQAHHERRRAALDRLREQGLLP